MKTKLRNGKYLKGIHSHTIFTDLCFVKMMMSQNSETTVKEYQ